MDAGRLEVLGHVAVQWRGRSSSGALPGRRAELVLAYLAGEHHRTVTADELADALWPDRLPETWSAALRGVVTEVRRYLEGAGLDPVEVLVTARRGYQLVLPAGLVLDLDEVREALAAATAALAAGDGTRAASSARRAAELARLPFLPTHDGEWVDGIRRELASIHGRALDVQARGHRAAGDLTAAATAAEDLVRAEPFREAGHQLRIRVLGESGDRAGAIRAYEQCRTTLAAELGVEPSAETKAALQEAMQAVASRTAAAAAPTAGPQARTPGDLSVLVVEDHDFQRRTAVRLLHGLGVEDVAEAGDGASALEALEGRPQPDVIICDIDMPTMDGVEFITHVAERGLASAVVVASGLDSRVLAAVKRIGETHGLQLLGTLEKPLTARRLGELLGSYRRHPTLAGAEAEVSVTEAEVAAALDEGLIDIVFEPVVDLTDGRVCGAEAMARWDHPSKGLVAPGVFLPVLAAQGLIPRYTDALLAAAASASAECRAAGRVMAIGADVDTALLGHADAASRIGEKVRAHGAEPPGLVCEVAERSLAMAPPAALDAVTRLRVKGFGVALDHFGARRLPAEPLAHLPFTQVKVDASLVTGVAAERSRLLLLEETLDLARSLGAPVVACGCASEADFDLAADMGFGQAQGPYLGQALSAADLVGRAASWSPGAGSGRG